MAVVFPFRRRSVGRLLVFVALGFVFRYIFGSQGSNGDEILEHNVLERVVTRSDKTLDVHRHPFLQARLGRDDSEDLLTGLIKDGVADFWEHYQKPYIMGHDTSHMDTQAVRSAIEELLGLNGWVAALCPTLVRPFGQNKRDDGYYDELGRQNHLYYVAIVIHSADHFLVDQLAVIVQMAKRLGTQNLFVSMLDYDSTDATPTLLDLCEAVLTLLGVPFRIRRVPGMTEDPSSAYYPLEEATTRNLALQPLKELYEKRGIKFHRVIWLKGFTCPNDILELIKVSDANEAAMVCGMDWAELNGFFIFSDRWRTRDMDGDQFRQSKSSSKPEAGPPRDKEGAARYARHLPFQVFCCESGTHVVDPAQSYYRGISYRSGQSYHNLSTTDSTPEWDPEAPCMDSSQAWFCRDLWVDAASDGMRDQGMGNGGGMAWLDPDGDENDYEARRMAESKPKIKRDAVPEDVANKDGVAEDGAGKHNVGKDAAVKDALGKDEVGKDTVGQDAAEKDAIGNDAGDNGAQKKDVAEKDVAEKDVAEKDSAGKDSAEKDSTGKDSKGKDSKGKDSKGKDSKGKDSKGKDAAGKDAAGKDAARKDAAGKDAAGRDALVKDAVVEDPLPLKRPGHPLETDGDENAGSDYDAMPDSDVELPQAPPPSRLSIPNSAFKPARILVNPRCVTTYAGVSHTKLAQDLFGEEDADGAESVGGKYVLDDWESAPDSFVCQEQRQTGGRKATKTQRRLGFMIHDELERGT